MENKTILKKILISLGFNKVKNGEHGWYDIDEVYIFEGTLWIFFEGKNENFIESNDLDVDIDKTGIINRHSLCDYQTHLNGDILDFYNFLKFFKKFYRCYIYNNIKVKINING